jgi:hypothetical protein
MKEKEHEWLMEQVMAKFEHIDSMFEIAQESPLDEDFSSYVSTPINHTTISTSIPNTSFTIDKEMQWELLVKQIDFWEPKSHITTTWAFYVTYKD